MLLVIILHINMNLITVTVIAISVIQIWLFQGKKPVFEQERLIGSSKKIKSVKIVTLLFFNNKIFYPVVLLVTLFIK